MIFPPGGWHGGRGYCGCQYTDSTAGIGRRVHKKLAGQCRRRDAVFARKAQENFTTETQRTQKVISFSALLVFVGFTAMWAAAESEQGETPESRLGKLEPSSSAIFLLSLCCVFDIVKAIAKKNGKFTSTFS